MEDEGAVAGPEGPAAEGGAKGVPAPDPAPAGMTADEVEAALSDGGGEEVEVEGDAYVWQGNYLYRRGPDGRLELAEAFLKPGDTAPDPYGQEWLTTDGEGNAVIKISLRVWATINFEHNSDKLSPDGEKVLEIFAQALSRPALASRSLLICGHTDSSGSPAYNLGLSRRRASSVAAWLSKKGGVEKKRLILAGYGDKTPIADNSTNEGRARNRRVEFILLQ
jgi:outer membrane protein OmpA-like peptidoglycan-associated protein